MCKCLGAFTWRVAPLGTGRRVYSLDRKGHPWFHCARFCTCISQPYCDDEGLLRSFNLTRGLYDFKYTTHPAHDMTRLESLFPTSSQRDSGTMGSTET
jgi:hypothetical protein